MKAHHNFTVISGSSAPEAIIFCVGWQATVNTTPVTKLTNFVLKFCIPV